MGWLEGGLVGSLIEVQARDGQGIPNSLGHKRHAGVQQAQRDVQGVDQIALSGQAHLGIVGVETAFAQLHVPVAEVVPEEGLQVAGIVAKAILVQRTGGRVHDLGQAREHPGILGGGSGGLARLVALKIHEHKATGVPDLGHKAAGLLGARAAGKLAGLLVELGVKAHVLVVGDEGEQVVAHGVCAIFGHEIHGIHAVTLGLGHAAAVFGQDCGVDDHVLEGDLIGEVERAHHHAGHPKRNDVAGGDQGLGGIMALHLLRMLRPALGGEGEQLRGEPGVQHAGVLNHMMAAALRTYLDIVHGGVFPATVLAGEHRDPMTPPQLAGDAPVFDVVHPGEVGLLPTGGMEGDGTGGHGICSRTLELVHRHKPLLREPRLQRGVAAIAVHDRMLVVFHMIQQVVVFEPRQDGGAGLIAVHAGEIAVAVHHASMLIKDVDLLQAMSLAHGKVVGVMGGGDLHKAGAKAGVHMPIGEDGNLTAHDGQHHSGAHELGGLRVVLRHGNAGVAQHGLRTGGGHHDVILAVYRLFEGVAQVPEVALLGLVLSLVVRDRRGAGRAPVHDALAAIDEPRMVPVAKDLAHRIGKLRAHGELLVREVCRTAHALDLFDDGAAVVAGPVPAGIDELLAAQLQPRNAFALELFVHLGLGRDAGVVQAHDPPGRDALHAVVADEGVLNGVVHGMAHVQHAGHIGGRNHYGAVAHTLVALVASTVDPGFHELRLDSLRVIVFGQVTHSCTLSQSGVLHSRPLSLRL